MEEIPLEDFLGSQLAPKPEQEPLRHVSDYASPVADPPEKAGPAIEPPLHSAAEESSSAIDSFSGNWASPAKSTPPGFVPAGLFRHPFLEQV